MIFIGQYDICQLKGKYVQQLLLGCRRKEVKVKEFQELHLDLYYWIDPVDHNWEPNKYDLLFTPNRIFLCDIINTMLAVLLILNICLEFCRHEGTILSHYNTSTYSVLPHAFRAIFWHFHFPVLISWLFFPNSFQYQLLAFDSIYSHSSQVWSMFGFFDLV